jgi:hypothetical protein
MAQKWKKAEHVPRSWEGRWAWRYQEWDKTIEHVTVPVSFSREPHHCRMVWFMLNEPPAPPTT